MMVSRTYLKGAILGGLMTASLGAVADDSADRSSGLWLLAKYDANGDHQISANEIGEKRQQMFLNMDNDNDGSVSFDEYLSLDAQRRQLILKARFNKLDLDQDGHVDTQEYSSYLGSFEQFDRNGDGKLSSKEMALQAEATSISKKTLDVNGTRCLLWLCVRTSL